MASTVDLLIFGLAPLVALWILSQERLLLHLDEVRDNWSENRCNPLQMPFASLIQPEVGTASNFNHCMAAMGAHILKQPLDTIQHILSQFTNMIKTVVEKLNVFRDLRQKLSGVMITMMTTIIGKLTAIISVFVGNLHKIRDLIRRMIGTGAIASYFGQLMFMFIKTLWNLAISILRAFVIAMMAISVALALFNPVLLGITIAIAALFGAAGGFSTL